MELLAHIASAKSAEYLIALGGLFGYIAFWRILNGPAPEAATVAELAKSIADHFAGFIVPRDVMFHPGHAWARMDGDSVVTVGLDDFAGKLLGNVDSIFLPKQGAKVAQGAPAWALSAESKTVDMLSPVEGQVIAINEALLNSPEAAIKDPYGAGWLFKVKSQNLASNVKNLMPVSMVKNWLENVRENLAHRPLSPAAVAMYQDGGAPISGIAKAIDPERWDELAKEFFMTN